MVLGCAGLWATARNPVASRIFPVVGDDDGIWGRSHLALPPSVTASKIDGVTGVSPGKEEDAALLQGTAALGAPDRSCALLSVWSFNY